MLFSAVAHCFVFSTDEWADGYRVREEERRRSATTRAFGDSVALGDFLSDVKVVMTSKKKRRKQRKRIQLEGGLSPTSSTGDDDEANALELVCSQSSDGDFEDVAMKSNSRKSESAECLNASSDQLDQDFNIDNGEYVMELSTPLPAKNKPRRRLDTEGSVDSDGGEMVGSLARIEKFINDHSPKPDDRNELV